MAKSYLGPHLRFFSIVLMVPIEMTVGSNTYSNVVLDVRAIPKTHLNGIAITVTSMTSDNCERDFHLECARKSLK